MGQNERPATAEFREASERKHATSSHMNRSITCFVSSSIVQKNNWNPGPRRRKEDAFEQQISETLQETSENVDHELLTNHFHVTITQFVQFSSTTTPSTPTSMSSPSTFMTQDGICLIKENRDGSYSLMCHISSSASERPEALYKVVSTYSNIYAKKKKTGIAKKLILTLRATIISQEIDLVASDLNGTAWRCRIRDNLSTFDEALMDCATGPHTTVGTWIHSGQLG